MWAFNFEYLRRYKKTFLLSIFCALVFSIPWDLWAVRSQIWSFPENTNLGFIIADLPLEEYLFIIFVTFEISSFALLLKKRYKLANVSG
jgi:lycopene cyclase domain-containing protein